MTQAQRDMEEAVEEWLDAHQGFIRYVAATERLYAVFAHAWQGSRRSLVEAFTEYREALLKEHEFKHPEVSEVYPPQRPGCQ